MDFYEKERETLFLPPETRERIREVWFNKYKGNVSKNNMIEEWIDDRLDYEETE